MMCKNILKCWCCLHAKSKPISLQLSKLTRHFYIVYIYQLFIQAFEGFSALILVYETFLAASLAVPAQPCVKTVIKSCAVKLQCLRRMKDTKHFSSSVHNTVWPLMVIKISFAFWVFEGEIVFLRSIQWPEHWCGL